MKKYNNHFIFSYTGNKRNEMSEIVKDVNLENIETIIEPFCGSCAFSYFTARDNTKKYKYILNDKNNNLIELFKICKDTEKLKEFEKKVNEIASDINKEKYKELIKQGCILGYYIKNKIYYRIEGLFPLNYKYKYIDIQKCPFINFIQNENITLSNINGVELIEKYKNDKKVFIFCDPPYLLSENGFYDCQECNMNENIYKYVYDNNVNKYKCKILFCLEYNWIVDLLFRNFKNHRLFDKKYTGRNKRKCKFINITNY